MNKKTKDLLDRAIDAARSVQDKLEPEGDFLPICYLGKDDGELKIIGLTFSNDKEKEGMINAVKVMAEEMDADFCMFAMEAWILMQKKEPDSKEFNTKEAYKYGRIADHPERVESMVFSLETRTGFWMGMSPLERIDGKRTFKDPEMNPIPKPVGLFTEILPNNLKNWK